MSYQALLFCPDERTARVVSQVLSELEFDVEPCHEPFAAVKKLMAQHFDALVVDCENEQNAALLFKSARNSGSNQAALAVAVVEGQAGVAKAFRLGANLVLTKPIHVEQSKGTLRVARGLLRKGQAAKPAGTGSSADASPSFPRMTLPFGASQSSAPPPAASASAFELDAEPSPQPDPADAALLEYMPDSVPSGSSQAPESTADSGLTKKYAWQPRSTMAEPMASALRKAAEAAGNIEFDTPVSNEASSSSAKGGAASAPARAKEAPVLVSKAAVAKPGIAPVPQRVAPPLPPDLEEEWNSATVPTDELSVPTFGQNAEEKASGGGGSRKILFAAVVLLAAAAAGYFGWTRMEANRPQPVAPPIVSAPATASLPAEPTPSATESQPPAGEITVTPQDSNPLIVTPSSSKPSAAVPVEPLGGKTSAPAKAAAEVDEATVVKPPASAKEEPSQPLVVKNGPSVQPKKEAAVSEPELAPSPTSITTGTDSGALSGLVNTNGATATQVVQTTKVSQGVSQGLLIKMVHPIYPPQAKQLRVEGKVELQANISRTGSITELKQLSGDPILGRAAIDAVKQWKYKPYFLNGEPIEIQTQITVNFKLP
ncbi:MAG TPA: TonB family protein [Terriglobales bacterium]|jgi:protein TonB|nr:TonB family protein [Terriglobales bacterium]